ncbi:MAG: AAA family ATPase, partial [Bacteroidia bacterium]
MTREIVLGLLSNKLQDVSFIPDTNILFGKYSYNQLTLGTYFIDYNESSLDFDLREYQEKYISSEYYKIPGYTQWNYYLIFIRTSYQEEQKIHIEKDDIYTRKFVFTPDELKKYFEYQKSDKAVDADIINVWKEKLKAVDLDEVYSEAPYTKAIPRYLANEVIKDIEVEQLTTKSNQKLTINKISHLKLKDDYRKYPVLKGFTLGKVNLIKGVNGSGKTSFLESIELIVAGKTIRNPSSPEKNNCIEATYNDGVLKDEYTPGDNSKYRERDIAWYASAAKSGNELFRSFNRYNFYDSDAAYNLSYNSNVGSSLSKYLS